jgi:glucokinase
MTTFVGVDLGGTQIRALLRDAQGQIVGRAATLTQANDAREAIFGRIVDTIRRAAQDVPWSAIGGIGVGVPGPVNPHTGVILQAPNIPGWDNVPIGDILTARCGVPTQVGNDANLAALGEYTYGAGQGCPNMIYSTISTGIGGGAIVDGKLLVGSRGTAAEFGHQTLVEDGPLCGCGGHGCLEALASGIAIARMGREAVAAGRAQRMLDMAHGSVEAIDARIVGDAAVAGDETAVAIIRRAATYIGTGLANVCNILNPELIVLGGGVTHIGALLFDTIRATIAVRGMPVNRIVRVVPAALGDDVVLLGAAALIAGAVSGGK